ncbi:MAG TPA: hypothetical protein VMD30_12665 [Tepidisphaeraceae bacterium]|nr:hypothetical protein [Tepidisphaeraceae bacterium]
MKNQEMEVSDIVIVLDEEGCARIDDVVKRLKDLGTSISSVDNDNGVIEGTVDATKLKEIHKFPGVKYVRNVFTYIAELPEPGQGGQASEEEDEEEEDVPR